MSEREAIERVSEMYRDVIKEAQYLSDQHNEIQKEMQSETITHKRYLELDEKAKKINDECNNQKQRAQGIYDVREMLLDSLK
ncbi:hypothetical protein IMZ31_24135 (plasmid) [Pontibacillus sp. ALD_SL1]|uniref:hypothetical protein n=1 Tax=Pontibacillus sp. ALD_SL1 TaxID=2777185 RepID=UPI001A97B0D0|nr:hypothetical protein [Pontibacillus sp. ALD_SL1]QST02542.1 hypothetical protein IMZ31_24135 [Pontibacillus sp. ALD_SL1]